MWQSPTPNCSGNLGKRSGRIFWLQPHQQYGRWLLDWLLDLLSTELCDRTNWSIADSSLLTPSFPFAVIYLLYTYFVSSFLRFLCYSFVYFMNNVVVTMVNICCFLHNQHPIRNPIVLVSLTIYISFPTRWASIRQLISLSSSSSWLLLLLL